MKLFRKNMNKFVPGLQELKVRRALKGWSEFVS